MGKLGVRVYDGAGNWVDQGDGTDETAPTPIIYSGAVALGSVSYSPPAGATVRHVSTSGNDSTGDGSSGTPWRTFSKALTSAPSGAYVVMHAGTYTDGDLGSSPTGKALNVIPNGTDVVWFDGSATIATGSWTNTSGSIYWAAYTPKPLSSSTSGGSNANRRACDQLFVDDVRYAHAGDGTAPAAGTFQVDRTANRIYANIPGGPTGKVTKVSSKSNICYVKGALTFQGIGFRYYSPEQITGGQFRSWFYCPSGSNGTAFVNCWFRGSSAGFVEFLQPDCYLGVNTFEDFGHTAVYGSRCDRLVMEYNTFRKGNRRGWQAQPETAGYKITSTDQYTIRFNYTEDVPEGMGNWHDVSNIRGQYYCNVVDGRDKGSGRMESCLDWEESDGGNLAGTQYRNLIVGNDLRGARSFGLLVLVSSYNDVWNNRLYENGTGQLCIQKDRIDNPNTTNPGDIDRLQSISPWRADHQRIQNNEFGYSSTGAGIQMLAYDDRFDSSSEQYLGWDLIEFLGGNWFRPAAPGSMVQLGKIDGTRSSFNSQAALAGSPSTVGGPPTIYPGSPSGKLGPNYQGSSAPDDATVAATALPLPADVAALLGVAVGARVIGVNPARLPTPRP